MQRIISRWHRWLNDRAVLLGAYRSLIGIISFPIIMIGGVLGYYNLMAVYAKPELYLSFSNPSSLTYTVTNTKNVVAEQPRYWFGIFEADNPSSVLPIPTKEVSYIGRETRSGDTLLTEKNAKPDIKYLGFAGVTCKNCEKTKYYIFQFVHGRSDGAWYMEIETERFQEFFVKRGFSPSNAEDHLLIACPPNRRLPIQ